MSSFFARGLEDFIKIESSRVRRISFPSSPYFRRRYLSIRTWSSWAPRRWILFVGLNPWLGSLYNNDENEELAIRAGAKLGFGGVGIINLFSFKTESRKLLSIVEPKEDKINDLWVKEASRFFQVRIACWGKEGRLHNRDLKVWQILKPMYCFGFNKDRSPKRITKTILEQDSNLVKFYINREE